MEEDAAQTQRKTKNRTTETKGGCNKLKKKTKYRAQKKPILKEKNTMRENVPGVQS